MEAKEEINSLEIYKTGEGYEIHINSRSIDDIINCESEVVRNG